jgi:hypothetical protein
MSAAITERRTALTVAAGLTAAALSIAVVVHVACAAETRKLLAFPFAGVPARPSSALAIFANNARLVGAVFAAVLVAQAPWLTGRAGARGPIATMLLAAVDTLLLLEVAFNTALVGAALGAYGDRMAAAVLPHGPIEVAAYALALALYLRARRTPVALRHLAAVAAICIAALALAAVLETFATP